VIDTRPEHDLCVCVVDTTLQGAREKRRLAWGGIVQLDGDKVPWAA
jgi:hypothetical protein